MNPRRGEPDRISMLLLKYDKMLYWDTSRITNMSRLFMVNKSDDDKIQGMRSFSFDPLARWDVSNVTDMSFMFYGVKGFDLPSASFDKWDVSNVITMESMFENSYYVDGMDKWNVSKVITMKRMFAKACVGSSSNPHFNDWDVSNVICPSCSIKLYQLYFNKPLNNWNVCNVVTMESMFHNACSFNQPLDNWQLDSVKNINRMFYKAVKFDQPLHSWKFDKIAEGYSVFDHYPRENMMDIEGNED